MGDVLFRVGILPRYSKRKMKTKLKTSKYCKKGLGLLAAAMVALATMSAQAPKPDPDVLELNNGERLIGHLVGATGGSLTFHSDGAGDVTVDWANVKSLKSSAKFAVVQKGVVLDKHADPAKIPQGTVSASEKSLSVDTGNGSPVVIPETEAANVVPQANFLNAFKTPKIGQDWHGSAGLGLDLVEATQKSRNINASVSLQRVVSSEAWISPRYKTLVDFNVSDSKLSQTGKQDITTDIVHGGLEHDMYLSSRLFAFVSADFLHSSAQGMKLQQAYGGGIGYVVLKDAHQELDVKAGIDYVHQLYEPVCATTLAGVTTCATSISKSLLGASLGETYTRSFKGGVAFHEGLTFIPAFNDSKYWTASAFANVFIPVHKRLSITIGGNDSYVNSPPLGFKKQSFEFVTALAYKIN